ncbi:MAG: efflux RND transporter periplasmic adaptor subunit [Bacteroidetes bacterium]|nr:efflux RND transporter periplasmic adaptor subunit [Bacteroidota bacterium]
MKTVIPITGLLVIAILLAACQREPGAQAEEHATQCLSDSMRQLIRLDTARMAPVQEEIKLNGTIEANENKVAKIFALVTGNVQDVRVELGDYVQRGQVLAVIHSGEIAELEAGLATAQANVRLAERNLARAEELFQSRLSSQVEVASAQRDLESAQQEVKRIREQMGIYSASGSGSRQVITAPFSGHLIEKNIAEGMQVRASDPEPMFVVADISELWVVANVYETDIAHMRTGIPVQVQTISYPNEIFRGTIDKVLSAIDPNTQAMKVRVTLHNPGGKLKPRMFATLLVQYPGGGGQKVAVAAQSLIFNDNHYYVIRMADPCKAEVREVKVAGSTTSTVFLDRGLKPDDQVVCRHQLLLFDALTKNQ